MKVVETTIDALSVDGKGVAHIDGHACFVAGGLPGDRAKLDVNLDAKPPQGRIVAMLAPSPQRVTHPCPHAHDCSGSSWGGLTYAAQLEAKRDLVARTLRHVLPEFDVPPVVASPRTWNYRSRASLNLWPENGSLRAGFAREARAHVGIPIHTCHLCVPAVDDCLHELPAALAAISDEDFTSRARKLQVHETKNGAGILLILAGNVSQNDERFWNAQLASIAPGGVWIASGTNAGIVRHDLPILHGENALPMQTSWLENRIDVHPAAFCQANAFAAHLVEEYLRGMATESQPQAVFDLYGGFGALGFAAARDCELFIFDVTAASAPTTKALAEMTGNKRAEFIAGDLLETFPKFIKRIQPDDLISLDPPRRGVHSQVLEKIIQSKARRVTYLSCNPACLARDLAILYRGMFHVKHLQPYDFFPQTPRIEVLTILERK